MAGRQSAYLSRELVSLRVDVLIHKDLEEFGPAPPMRREMFGLCEELEFRTILDMLKREWAGPEDLKPAGPKPRTRGDRVIRTREELAELVGIAQTKSLIAIEIETTLRTP